jgi:hypothetical protein
MTFALFLLREWKKSFGSLGLLYLSEVAYTKKLGLATGGKEGGETQEREEGEQRQWWACGRGG